MPIIQDRAELKQQLAKVIFVYKAGEVVGVQPGLLRFEATIVGNDGVLHRIDSGDNGLNKYQNEKSKQMLVDSALEAMLAMYDKYLEQLKQQPKLKGLDLPRLINIPDISSPFTKMKDLITILNNNENKTDFFKFRAEKMDAISPQPQPPDPVFKHKFN